MAAPGQAAAPLGIGGRNDYLGYISDVYSYDVVNDVWTRKPSMPYAMSSAACVTGNFRDGPVIFCAKGEGPTAETTRQVVFFNLLEEIWTTLPERNTANVVRIVGP